MGAKKMCFENVNHPLKSVFAKHCVGKFDVSLHIARPKVFLSPAHHSSALEKWESKCASTVEKLSTTLIGRRSKCYVMFVAPLQNCTKQINACEMLKSR